MPLRMCSDMRIMIYSFISPAREIHLIDTLLVLICTEAHFLD